MHRLIFPEILSSHAAAFFTGRSHGADHEQIAELFKIPKKNICLPIQKHTDRVLIIKTSFEPEVADAVMTDQRGLLIGVQVADCVPVLLCDPVNNAVAAVHAGWRGTAQGILKKTIRLFSEAYLSDPSDILAAIGPSIRQCCYEVDSEVISSVSDATGAGNYFTGKGLKYQLDLAGANLLQALDAGLERSNIWVSDDCTFCSPEKFFSYRFSGGQTGRQAGFIGFI